jgi:hypothetical protein
MMMCGKLTKLSIPIIIYGVWRGLVRNWSKDKMCVLIAHTSVHCKRQSHEAHAYDIGKMPNKTVLSMVLDQFHMLL